MLWSHRRVGALFRPVGAIDFFSISRLLFNSLRFGGKSDEGPGARKRNRVWWYVGGTAVVTGVTAGIVYALTRSKTTPVTIVVTLP